MNKKKIKGKLVILKELNPKLFDDYRTMFSPIVKHILHVPEETKEESDSFLSKVIKKHKKGKTLFYCIFKADEDKLIGSIEIREKEENPGQLGNWINENYWGKGFYQEALKLITKEYFRIRKNSEYTAHVDISNKRSYFALKKFGFEDNGFFENKNKEKQINLVFKKK